MKQQSDLEQFVSAPKRRLVAPAMHGKTYNIAQIVSFVDANKPQRILTRTHWCRSEKELPKTGHLA